VKFLLFALCAMLALSVLLGATHLGGFTAYPSATYTTTPALEQPQAQLDLVDPAVSAEVPTAELVAPTPKQRVSKRPTLSPRITSVQRIGVARGPT
jgi:hypothetical protein